ncbi:MAG: GDP-mannose 4,6-dehydratase [Burkholderiaceae bacterium]|nr:GDP-mannose 4,6-dehydratase [Burkholderiaceae bacterium]
MASLSDPTPVASRGRVLLTGAGGFTGGYVKTELERAGFRVAGAVFGAALHGDQVSLDIASLDACRRVIEQVRPDYLVHLAGVSFVEHAAAVEFYRVNVIGTLNLLQALADVELTPRQVLIASSANVYGNAAGSLDESQPPQPVNHYAASKLAMEHLVKTWCERLPIVIARPFNYTGVGQDERFLAPKIVAHFKARAASIELGNLDIERDFSDVRMVARAYRRLLQTDCAGETFNICSGQPYSLRSIVETMEEIAGYRIAVRVNPAFVRASDVKSLVGSAEKLRARIGDLQLIPLRETLLWMYRAPNQTTSIG